MRRIVLTCRLRRISVGDMYKYESTKAERRLLRRMRYPGDGSPAATMAQMVQATGLQESVIREALGAPAHGALPRKPRKIVSARDTAAAVAMLTSGSTFAEVAAHFGASSGEVRAFAQRNRRAVVRARFARDEGVSLDALEAWLEAIK